MTAIPISELENSLVSKESLSDPYPTLHRLREEDPVHRSESIGGWVAVSDIQREMSFIKIQGGLSTFEN